MKMAHSIYTVVGNNLGRDGTFVDHVAGTSPREAAKRARALHGGVDVKIIAVFEGEHYDVMPESPGIGVMGLQYAPSPANQQPRDNP